METLRVSTQLGNISLPYSDVDSLSLSHLAVAVLYNHEHWRVLALHGSVQRLDAHAMLGRAKSQRPRVADRPRREILGELQRRGTGGERESERGRK